MISRELKEELKALSKELLGSASKYQKILDKGISQPLMEEITEYIPGETDSDEGTTRQVQVNVKHKNINISTTKRFTPTELRNELLILKARRKAFTEHVAKMQADAKAKKEAEENQIKINKELNGSAV